MGTWEYCMRKLVRAKPQVFVDLMIEQLEVERHVRCMGEYPRSEKLADSPFEVDTLLDVLVDERSTSLIHFEWQAYYTNVMPERLLRYGVLVRCELESPVLSCVWHMLNDTRIKPSPLHWTEPITGDVLKYRYVVIEMADLVAQDLFERGEIVLLPFVPLAQGGATRANVQRMLDLLSGQGHEELAYVGFTLARSVFTKAHDEANYAWLLERYGTMNSMIHDLLDEDPVYLSIMQRGLQKGRLQTAQQTALQVIAARFPALEQLAQEIIETISDANRLQVLVVELSVSSSQEQAKELLLSLVSAV
jgi:hypothetical protein